MQRDSLLGLAVHSRTNARSSDNLLARLNSPRLAVALMRNAANDLMSLLVHICDSGTTECFLTGCGGQRELLLVTGHKVETVVIWCLFRGFC